ncbi:bifunctional DNA-formamidopyrimidine glycosylase/DNA-(apurinic or apyrimidinic site) lyase [Pelotomaculum propionicicum]|uniref:bifunctional DNA-formamidopyrimidine glycosylase/DNA-(apurinic or apyrimidinic site) lyase n=1 Tax=Pelotomaculum propionicicum TaxID=258475 RepID=UPI003B7FCDA0
MPELPEVETVNRTLQPKLTGLKFTDVQVLLPKIVRTPEPGEFIKIIRNKKILDVSRRGKYLLISLSGGYTLAVHLRMTGRLVYSPDNLPPTKHTHVVFHLDNGHRLTFADMRQFGGLWLVPTSALKDLSGFKDLGIEPLGEQFTRDFLKKELRRRRARIKPLLLDQTFIAGLGNIYTDEALHRAGVDPERLATTLTSRETTKLHHAVKDVLMEGIEHRGTTFRDFLDGDGRAGGYQERLRVYNREGKPCPRCGQAIKRKKVGGRSSYYCPSCQK